MAKQPIKPQPLKVLYKTTAELIPFAKNSRTHSEHQIQQIAASIKEWGFTNPILIDEDQGIIAGHGRLQAAQLLKMGKVPTITLVGLSTAQKRAYVIADNKLALNAGWDEEMLGLELTDLQEQGFEMELMGFSQDELDGFMDIDGELYVDGLAGQMATDFGFAPFSVLNAREGGWQKRKDYWLSQGLKSELGRGEDLISYNKISVTGENDTSVFDPVLCELAYKWFSPKGGLALDPFAGGSVRGVVAAKCGREYIGNDLRQEQVLANAEQAESLCGEGIMPKWTCGDSQNIKKLVGDIKADFVLSCPPYADLEVYSDDKADLSNMGYQDFLTIYKKIIKETFDLLNDDTFAVWVVGEVRDKKGNYYNFVGDTISAFKEAGFNYYNEAILVTAVGSLPLRAGKVMRASRKLGKTHQNILVFVKGDGKRATKKLGVIEGIEMPEEEDAD